MAGGHRSERPGVPSLAAARRGAMPPLAQVQAQLAMRCEGQPTIKPHCAGRERGPQDPRGNCKAGSSRRYGREKDSSIRTPALSRAE